MKYADGLVILTKEETMLQCNIPKLSETGRSFGMEMNVEKLRKISRQTSPIHIITDQKQPANVEYFTCFDSTITNDVIRTDVKLNPGLSWQKQH